jgi:hypothetical protein
VLKVWGAVLATTVAFCAIGLIGYVRAQRVRPFEYELRRLGFLLTIAFVNCAISTLVRPGEVFLQLVLAGVMITGYPAVLYATGFFDGTEREALQWMGRIVWVRTRRIIRSERAQPVSEEAKLGI